MPWSFCSDCGDVESYLLLRNLNKASRTDRALKTWQGAREKTDVMTSEFLCDLLQRTGHEPYKYSHTYGEKCVAFDVPSRSFSLFHLGIAMVANSPDDALEIEKLRVRTDSMGMGMVVYFPNVPWVAEQENTGGRL